MKNERRQRGVTTASVLLGLLGVSVLAGAGVVYQYGAVKVYVEEKRPGGERVRLWVPGVLAPVALKLIPDEELRLPPEARRWMPALRAAGEELQRVEDFTLVEVEDGGERVRIEKRNGALLIDVVSEDETVHVSIPLRVVLSVARQLESAGPPG
jgi:hypothetical protein